MKKITIDKDLFDDLLNKERFSQINTNIYGDAVGTRPMHPEEIRNTIREIIKQSAVRR